MKTRLMRWIALAATLCVLGLLVWATASGPSYPVALVRVVDATGKPVAGAVIRPEGLRTKPGPYVSGWYGWHAAPDWPTNAAVTTDAAGCARVPYPKYVFERIETGTIIFSVNHPDFVPGRPELLVTWAPPSGAPWRTWADYVWNRIRHKAFTAHPDPVVLQKGAILKLSVRPGSAASGDTRLFAQVSGVWGQGADFWIRPDPAMIKTRRLEPGPHTVRAIQFDAKGSVWFSDVVSVKATADQTNEVVVELKPGVAVHGRLDATVPRPVTHGRVVAHVWPTGTKAKDSPPEWHAWTTVRGDGSFDISNSLPAGDLEIVALCDGFVSTNGPGQFGTMHYPQKHLLGTNDLEITLGMEPTACLEVEVRDDQGKLLKGAQVSTWPNVRYGEWSAVILASDCYNTADVLRGGRVPEWWRRGVQDFQATSDSSGLAVIMNLPVEINQFNVEHPRFTLPAFADASGQKRRQANITLTAGQTNHVAVRLEPRDQSPIRHY